MECNGILMASVSVSPGSVFYLSIVQLALQAANLFREPEGFRLIGGQIARESLDLTLKMTKRGWIITAAQGSTYITTVIELWSNVSALDFSHL